MGRVLVRGPTLVFRRRDVGWATGGFHTFRVHVWRWIRREAGRPAGLWTSTERETIARELGRVG